VAGTYFTLFKSFVGVGVLTLPHAFQRAGYVGGAVGLVTVGVLSYFCMRVLLRCGEKITGVASFASIGREALGPWGGAVVNLFVVVTQIGFCIGYIIFVAANLERVVAAISPGVKVSQGVFALIFGACVVPLVLLRTIKGLHCTSLVADFIIVFGLLVIVGSSVSTLSQNHTETQQAVQAIDWVHLPLFFGLSVSAFEGIAMVLPVQQSMAEPHRFPAMLRVVMLWVCSLYVLIAALGYMAYGDETEDSVTLNLPHGNALSPIVQLGYSFAIFFSYPVMMFPATQILEKSKLFEQVWSGGSVVVKTNVFRVLLVAVTCLVAMAVPHFALFANLIGALACSCLAFVLPAVFYLKLYKGEISGFHRCVCYCSVLFGVVGGTISVYSTIDEMARVF